MKRKKYLAAFTLTELLIVIGILTFLILFVALSVRRQTAKGQDAKRKADARRIGIAAEEYEKDNNCYPLPALVVCDPGTGLQPYLDKIPCDPLTDASYYYEHEDSACPKWYKIYVRLDNDSDPDYLKGVGPGGFFTYVYTSPNAPQEVVTGNPPPVGEGGPPPGTSFYGCISGVCTSIGWDSARPGPECDPNFQNSTCYGQCANPDNECMSWN